MALLRLPCSPSTKYFSTDHLHQTFHNKKIHPSSSVSIKSFDNNNNNTFSFSCFLSHTLSFSHFHTLSTRKINTFVLHFSSATETQLQPDSKTAEEEYSSTRLLAQNVPWTCTAEDIRALFEKFGNVVNVELSMHNKTRNRGLAFVTMGSPEEANVALKNLESYEFEGRTLRMNAKVKNKKRSPPMPPELKPTFNLFVANLPFEARAKDLKEFFNTEGANIVSAEIIFHDNPRRSSGYGFVAFKSKKEADEARSTFQGKTFMGRPLRVAQSRQYVKRQRREELQSDGTSTKLNTGAEQADTAGDN